MATLDSNATASPLSLPFSKELLNVYVDGFIATDEWVLKVYYVLAAIVSVVAISLMVKLFNSEAASTVVPQIGSGLVTVLGIPKCVYDIFDRRESLQKLRNHSQLIHSISAQDPQWSSVSSLLTELVKARLDKGKSHE